MPKPASLRLEYMGGESSADVQSMQRLDWVVSKKCASLDSMLRATASYYSEWTEVSADVSYGLKFSKRLQDALGRQGN